MKVWDKIAEGWHYIRQQPLELVKRFANEWKPGQLIDIGCGTGRHAFLFAKTGFDVIGIDSSEKMIELAIKEANKKKLKVRFEVMDATDLKINQKFDYAIMIAVLHTIQGNSKRDTALISMRQVLKKGGFGLISVLNHKHPQFANMPKETELPWSHKGKKYMRYYYLYDPEEFRTEIEKHFRILEMHEEKNIWCVVKNEL